MADIIRPFPSIEPEETDEPKKNRPRPKKNRFGRGAAYIGIAILGIVLVICFYLSSQSKNYSTYTILDWTEIENIEDSEVVEFQDNLLRYTRDGAAYVSYSGEQIWNQSFEMTAPVIDVKNDAVAIADKGGNDVYVFSASGLTGQIETTLAIQDVSVSDSGTVAVLMRDGSSSKISYMKSDGTLISEMKITMDTMGYPIDMDLSPNGQLFAVSYLSVAAGSTDTILSVYNFGDVGQEYNDRLVKAKTYEGEIFPSIHFTANDTLIAFGDSQAVVYKGKQIPEETTAVAYNAKARSVFYNSDYFGVVLEGDTQESGYTLKLYDLSGSEQMSKDITIEYTNVKIQHEKVILFNESECVIYSLKGVEKYDGTFEDTIRNVIATKKDSRYYFLTPTRLNSVKLE